MQSWKTRQEKQHWTWRSLTEGLQRPKAIGGSRQHRSSCEELGEALQTLYEVCGGRQGE
jgi:hypothetical protein